MATRGRLINLISAFLHILSVALHVTCPLDDSHRGNIWCARITQLSKDFLHHTLQLSTSLNWLELVTKQWRVTASSSETKLPSILLAEDISLHVMESLVVPWFKRNRAVFLLKLSVPPSVSAGRMSRNNRRVLSLSQYRSCQLNNFVQYRVYKSPTIEFGVPNCRFENIFTRLWRIGNHHRIKFTSTYALYGLFSGT